MQKKNQFAWIQMQKICFYCSHRWSTNRVTKLGESCSERFFSGVNLQTYHIKNKNKHVIEHKIKTGLTKKKKQAFKNRQTLSLSSLYSPLLQSSQVLSLG